MKTKFWLTTFGTMISTSLLAQPTVTTPPASADTNVYREMSQPPVRKKVVKRPVVKKFVEELRTVPLVPGPATVVATRVNVRGQGRLKGEVLTRLNKGDAVTVIEEIKLEKSAVDEPSAWAKIVLPAAAPAWVSTKYIDPVKKTVTVKKLNVRGGPGENYSVIGSLQKGDVVGEIIVRGDWTKIEPSPNFYAFMAAQYLEQSTTVEATTVPAEMVTTNAMPPEMTPIPTPVTEENPVPPPSEMIPPPTETVLPAPVAEEPPPKRIVAHEGVVRGTVSIQAPTPYALVASDTGELVNYLYTSSTNLDLSRYKGLRIIVTGEEGLDARWKSTPVLTIQRIQVIE